jgi:hypothetical protein
LELNDNENAVSADLEGKAFPIRLGLCVAQHGALPDDELVDKFYVDDEITLKNALNNYGAGDEIYITQDVTYTGDMVFTRPCTLTVMHHTLTINGNLIYTYMYGGRFVLNTVSDGHINILKNKGAGGNFQIDLPDTSLEIVGANNDNNADIYVAGSFTANASKEAGEGIFFKGARICNSGSTELKPLLVNGPARISISNRTRMGDITANGYCRKFVLENGGYVFKKPNPGDGRSYLVGLTPAGLEVLELFRKAHAALEKKLYANLTEEQKKNCMVILSEMEANLK